MLPRSRPARAFATRWSGPRARSQYRFVTTAHSLHTRFTTVMVTGTFISESTMRPHPTCIRARPVRLSALGGSHSKSIGLCKALLCWCAGRFATAQKTGGGGSIPRPRGGRHRCDDARRRKSAARRQTRAGPGASTLAATMRRWSMRRCAPPPSGGRLGPTHARRGRYGRFLAGRSSCVRGYPD
jgi:hypothetical protein